MRDTQLQQAALLSKAWPFEEARRIKPRISADDKVIFQTGYGPSGLPHLGTFAEVLRTSMVRHAFSMLNPDVPTRLICFSDDLDALRSVPDNVPNASMLEEHLGKPLTRVPDPFGTHESFAAHNNACLRSFLDRFGFEYEFASSTDYYLSGRFDDVLLQILHSYDEIMEVMLPSLREERRQTYAPFLPICPKSGKVLMVPILERDAENGLIRYRDPDSGKVMETSVTGGRCKLQWKVDWAARWAALGVNYEMSGKDLIDSVTLSGKICRILGASPPVGFSFELFLDSHGRKISKSRGNGMTIDKWLDCAPPESLELFVYREPRRAKRFHFQAIPKYVDEYLAYLDSYPKQSAKERLVNPVWHIHSGNPPIPEAVVEGTRIDFQLLLNLVNASNASNAQTLWGFLQCYAPSISPESHPGLDSLVHNAVAYYHEYIACNRARRPPTTEEVVALQDLIERLQALPPDADAKTIQNEIYAVGKSASYEELRTWFQALYEILLGVRQGPRFGSFIHLYGIDNSIKLIQEVLEECAQEEFETQEVAGGQEAFGQYLLGLDSLSLSGSLFPWKENEKKVDIYLYSIDNSVKRIQEVLEECAQEEFERREDAEGQESIEKYLLELDSPSLFRWRENEDEETDIATKTRFIVWLHEWKRDIIARAWRPTFFWLSGKKDDASDTTVEVWSCSLSARKKDEVENVVTMEDCPTPSTSCSAQTGSRTRA